MAGFLLLLIASCARVDEAQMRARLTQWFYIGDTLSFGASRGCAAAVFKLADFQLKLAMPQVQSVPQMLISLSSRRVAALNDPTQPPDQSLVDLANAERTTGMRMRKVALESRNCMDVRTESAFSYALVDPLSVLAYDSENETLMLLYPRAGVLVVVMGSGE
ncbi:hypothetical protein MNBD_ALPHA07-1736 [hydrothermal vent metagenome]|uniref:Uncharacterized protein n=1 Tax=hydrothermal vent metagenome TaxID=652676 RepID=A0A3B0SZ90_9ZZZZ